MAQPRVAVERLGHDRTLHGKRLDPARGTAARGDPAVARSCAGYDARWRSPARAGPRAARGDGGTGGLDDPSCTEAPPRRGAGPRSQALQSVTVRQVLRQDLPRLGARIGERAGKKDRLFGRGGPGRPPGATRPHVSSWLGGRHESAAPQARPQTSRRETGHAKAPGPRGPALFLNCASDARQTPEGGAKISSCDTGSLAEAVVVLVLVGAAVVTDAGPALAVHSTFSSGAPRPRTISSGFDQACDESMVAPSYGFARIAIFPHSLQACPANWRWLSNGLRIWADARTVALRGEGLRRRAPGRGPRRRSRRWAVVSEPISR
jgi:hypothetical protein